MPQPVAEEKDEYVMLAENGMHAMSESGKPFLVNVVPWRAYLTIIRRGGRG